jgi:hypothetical protein
LIAVPATINAQDAAATNSPSATMPAKKHGATFKGKVSAVDATAMTVTVASKTYNITSETKITKDGKPATLADVVVDDTVGGTYKTDASGKLNALTLRDGVKKKPTTTQ